MNTNYFSDILAKFYKDITLAEKKIKSSEEVTEEMISEISSGFKKDIRFKMESVFKDESDANYLNLKEVMYIIAAMIDESFIRMNWESVNYWESNLVEEAIFKTHASGYNIFKQIDKILNESENSKVEIAKVYLDLLSLGFTGKYGRDSQDPKLKNYKIQLFRFVYQEAPSIGVESAKIIPKAYETIRSDVRLHAKFDKKINWLLFGFLSVFLYFSFTLYSWNKNTSNLKSEVESVMKIMVSEDKDVSK